MRGGGVPYCPWWGGPWGEHGVCPFDEPLWAGGRSCSGHYVVVPLLEDCTPGGLQALTATLALTLIKTEYWDRAGGGGNISYDW